MVSFVSPSQRTLVPNTHAHTLQSEKLLLSLVYCFQTLKYKFISEAVTIPRGVFFLREPQEIKGGGACSCAFSPSPLVTSQTFSVGNAPSRLP